VLLVKVYQIFVAIFSNIGNPTQGENTWNRTERTSQRQLPNPLNHEGPGYFAAPIAVALATNIAQVRILFLSYRKGTFTH